MYLLYSFKSDLLPPSSCSWVEGCNFWWPYNGEENLTIFNPLFFPPSVSLLITQKCWLLFISGCRLRKAPSNSQEQCMLWIKSLLCRALQRSLSSPMTVLPCLSHTSKQNSADTVLFCCCLKCKREAVWLGRAGIYTALCSSWACCLWRRTRSAPECPPAGLLLSHVPENTPLAHQGMIPELFVCSVLLPLLLPRWVHPHSTPPWSLWFTVILISMW